MPEYDFTKNFKESAPLERLTHFLFEVSHLKNTPRSGYSFLGSGQENVAEHSFGTSVIGYVLAQMAGADPNRTVLLCLFHDLHETRTGDFNYVNRRYNTSQRTQALKDATAGTGLELLVLPLWEELEAAETLEAQIAQDADQLDFILRLKEQLDLGNPLAGRWLDNSLKRLRTDVARELALKISETDHTDWWFKGPAPEWWQNKNGKK